MEKGIPGAGELVEPAGAGEDDDTNLSIAENRKLLGFLQESVPSLGESHLTTRRVINPLDRDLTPSHFLQPLIQKTQKHGQTIARGRYFN